LHPGPSVLPSFYPACLRMRLSVSMSCCCSLPLFVQTGGRLEFSFVSSVLRAFPCVTSIVLVLPPSLPPSIHPSIPLVGRRAVFARQSFSSFIDFRLPILRRFLPRSRFQRRLCLFFPLPLAPLVQEEKTPLSNNREEEEEDRGGAVSINQSICPFFLPSLPVFRFSLPPSTNTPSP